MRVQKRGKYLTYLLIDEKGNPHYIGRDEDLKAEMLQKELLLSRSNALGYNIDACRALQHTLQPTAPLDVIKNMKHGLCRIPEERFYRSKPSGMLIPKPVNDPEVSPRQLKTVLAGITAEEWMNFPYQENTKFLEGKKHLGTNGLYFRSRAEMLISGIYERNNWLYHYDERLCTADGTWISPDFQHPGRNCEMFYHEHCELGSEEYSRNFTYKLSVYLSNGIIPGKNLNITWSHENGTLNLQQIERILKAYYE